MRHGAGGYLAAAMDAQANKEEAMTEKTFRDLAPELMEKMASTFRERNAVYKDNWKLHSGMLMALFPDGITIKTREDWERFNFFLMITVKISRYVECWKEGGHSDSIHDVAVYAAMLEAYDILCKEERK